MLFILADMYIPKNVDPFRVWARTMNIDDTVGTARAAPAKQQIFVLSFQKLRYQRVYLQLKATWHNSVQVRVKLLC